MDSRIRAHGSSMSTGGTVEAWVRFGAVWAAVSLLPSAVVPLIVLVNEHRCYLASAGLAIAVAGCAGLLLARSRWLSALAVSVWATIAIGLTVERGEAWVDEVSLWRDAARQGPLMVKPHLRLGDALARAGHVEEAERSYLAALELRPAHVGSRNNLGLLYMQSGRTREAAAQFRALLEYSPDAFEPRMNLAGLLLREGAWTEAKSAYEAALRYDDTAGVAQGRLGYIALKWESEPARALEHYHRALSLVQGREERASVLVGRGAALRALGRHGEAESTLRQAVREDDRCVDAWYNLGNLLEATGRRAPALEAFRRVLEIEPRGSLSAPARARMERLAEK